MCGIIGVVSRPAGRPVPSAAEILGVLQAAVSAQPDPAAVAEALGRVDSLLRGAAGIAALADAGLVDTIERTLNELDGFAATIESELDASSAVGVDEIERRSALSIALRDRLWAVRRDRLGAAAEVNELAGPGSDPRALSCYLAIRQAVAAIDRLEVRGRDSAGVHIFVSGHGLDPTDPETAAMCADRLDDPLFQSTSLRWSGDVLSVVYKAAAEIGELGDNTRVIRTSLAADEVLRRAIASPTASVSVLGHTRWASVGIISEPNTHPLNSDEVGDGGDLEIDPHVPYVVAALNGDVDNHADLRVEHQLRIPAQITTDAKIIPAMVAREAAGPNNHLEAFRRTVNSFDGSVAIAAMFAEQPGRLLLALRGSGQGLFVGITEDGYIVASEPYGVVEETDRYLRLDGERGGEVVELDPGAGDGLAGLRRVDYSGVERPVSDDELISAEITTRDIDRGDAPHFLLKEISEAPESFRRTVRGKVVEIAGRLSATLGERALPASIVDRLRSGTIARIRVIGQGTAAVAGQSIAALIEEICDGALDVRAVTATELSGFQMRLDMSDTLAIAVSQSGTTTDTNRTVDLLRSRGAGVIAIVNRRGSDLVDKSDGVLYTSDGRDVEMSVASTKAFYAQVAAGALLACAIAETAGWGDPSRRHELLAALRTLPDAMRIVLADRESIAAIAARHAPSKRYWAVVGNGPNRVAAEEIRIKLSELCYKSIACDNTEDKKHIDLSSEPLIVLCAAGLRGSIADDVAKETAIFRAHKATPIVIADEGDTRYPAVATISVPVVDPALAFVLSAMAGHLFGYEAARAIDATAVPLRAARETIEQAVAGSDSPDEILATVRSQIGPSVDAFNEILGRADYDGQLDARTVVQLARILRDLEADDPVAEYQRRTGRVGEPGAVIDDLVAALTLAIEELTRPIDAIKHQAKTVTVGISRSDEGVIDRVLVQAVLGAGAGRERLSYQTLRVLAELDPAVAEVTGFTRYGIEGSVIQIIDRGGLARDLPSRVQHSNELVGTKRRVAAERAVLVARGRSDGRHVIFVPELKGGDCTGITLLHVRFHDRLDVETMRAVLVGYDRRFDRLVDWVSETEGHFDESLLATLSVADVLISPISETADHWRR